MSRHEGVPIDRLALLAAAIPVITGNPDFPEDLDESEVNPLIEGARTDRVTMNAEFGELSFLTEQSEEMMDWSWGLGMEASGRATVASARTWQDADLRPDLDDIAVSTSVYHGVHDEVTPIEITGEVLAEGRERRTGSLREQRPRANRRRDREAQRGTGRFRR